MDLTAKHCEPCEGGTEPMSAEEADFILADQGLPWQREGGRICRDLVLKDFAAALTFVNRVGALAEAEGHHPDMLIHGYKEVRLTLTTHAIRGLSENDFILAAKIEALHADS